MKHFVDVVRIFLCRIFFCSSFIIVFRQTNHISAWWCWDSAASNITLTCYDEISVVPTSIHSTYVVFADDRRKVSIKVHLLSWTVVN